MSQQRVFSEQEVADIVKRAVALQEENQASSQNYRAGVTHEELLRAAQEMGVDPTFLDQAIREKLQGHKARGLAIMQEQQRVVEGELDPQDFDLILEQIRTASTRRHPVTQVGRTLSARAMTGSGMARLEVTSRNGRTRINVKPWPAFEIIGTFYPAFLISMIGGTALAERGMPGVGAAVAAGAFAAAALVCRGWMARSASAASRLADKLQSIVSNHVNASVREQAAASSAQLVEPGEIQELRVE